MNRIVKLLSFSGRASRLSFWRWFLLSTVLSGAIYVLSVYVALAGFPGSKPIAMVILACMVLLLWPGVAVGVRRLHDRNKSAWWMLVFAVLPFIIQMGALQLIALGHAAVMLGLLLSLSGVGLVVWSWIEFGFLRGTRGVNRFGPEPARL